MICPAGDRGCSFAVACVIVHRVLSGGVGGQTCGVLVEGLPSVLSVVFSKDPAQRFLEPSRRGKPPGAAFEVAASPILAATGSVAFSKAHPCFRPFAHWRLGGSPRRVLPRRGCPSPLCCPCSRMTSVATLCLQSICWRMFASKRLNRRCTDYVGSGRGGDKFVPQYASCCTKDKQSTASCPLSWFLR